MMVSTEQDYKIHHLIWLYLHKVINASNQVSFDTSSSSRVSSCFFIQNFANFACLKVESKTIFLMIICAFSIRQYCLLTRVRPNNILLAHLNGMLHIFPPSFPSSQSEVAHLSTFFSSASGDVQRRCTSFYIAPLPSLFAAGLFRR